MESICSTQWITIRLASSDQIAVAASEASYVDVSEYDDIAIYLDVKEVSGTINVTFQTSPSKDDASFVALFPAVSLTAPTTTGPIVSRVFGNFAPIPIAKWLRWHLGAGGGTFDITFRVFMAAHSYGG